MGEVGWLEGAVGDIVGGVRGGRYQGWRGGGGGDCPRVEEEAGPPRQPGVWTTHQCGKETTVSRRVAPSQVLKSLYLETCFLVTDRAG